MPSSGGEVRFLSRFSFEHRDDIMTFSGTIRTHAMRRLPLRLLAGSAYTMLAQVVMKTVYSILALYGSLVLAWLIPTIAVLNSTALAMAATDGHVHPSRCELLPFFHYGLPLSSSPACDILFFVEQ